MLAMYTARTTVRLPSTIDTSYGAVAVHQIHVRGQTHTSHRLVITCPAIKTAILDGCEAHRRPQRRGPAQTRAPLRRGAPRGRPARPPGPSGPRPQPHPRHHRLRRPPRRACRQSLAAQVQRTIQDALPASCATTPFSAQTVPVEMLRMRTTPGHASVLQASRAEMTSCYDVNTGRTSDRPLHVERQERKVANRHGRHIKRLRCHVWTVRAGARKQPCQVLRR